ncbi:MAG: baseplate J/gp47 family protein [Sebaldella sp.]|nr:baseplate J/gp47 family protein [Sebaldella sp.]
MARIEVNTLAENQNIMFDEFRKLLGDKVTNDPRSALYMLLFPISLLARHKNEKIQTLADKMNVTKCEGSELDDILNSNLSFPRKNPNYATVFITLRGGLGVQLYAGDLIIEAKDGTQYTLIEDGILNNSGKFKFECNMFGIIGNKEAGEIIKFVKIKSGIYDLLNDTQSAGGQEEETDNEYLQRWYLSKKDGAWNIDAIQSALLKLNGVSSVFVDENHENTKVNDMDPKSILIVVAGGDADEIAQTIWLKKDQSIATMGDIQKTVLDNQGNLREINFYRPSKIDIEYKIDFKLVDGNTITSTDLNKLVENYINNIQLAGYLTSYDCESNYIRVVYDNTKLLNIDVYFKRKEDTEYSKVLKLKYNEVANAVNSQ